MTVQIPTHVSGPSTYLNSLQTISTRQASAQEKRPGSKWSLVVTVHGRVVTSISGLATAGDGMRRLYDTHPELFTRVTRIDADQTHWEVTTATPARPGYGKGSDGVVIGTAMVILTEEVEEDQPAEVVVVPGALTDMRDLVDFNRIKRNGTSTTVDTMLSGGYYLTTVTDDATRSSYVAHQTTSRDEALYLHILTVDVPDAPWQVNNNA